MKRIIIIIHPNLSIFFAVQGFNRELLFKTKEDVCKMSREILLTYKDKSSEQENKTVLTVTWHSKFRAFATILHHCYAHMLQVSPNMANIFPSPRVAYKHNPTFKNILTRSRFTSAKPHVENERDNSKTSIKSIMNNTGYIKNEKTGITSKIEVGSAQTGI